MSNLFQKSPQDTKWVLVNSKSEVFYLKRERGQIYVWDGKNWLSSLFQESLNDAVELCEQQYSTSTNESGAAENMEGGVMSVPGYEMLADVLERAYNQAASGKGKERHAQGEPFHEQVMQIGADKFGPGALLFQAFKKSEESQRLPKDRAINELLGAINYLAGAVIYLERQDASRSPD